MLLAGGTKPDGRGEVPPGDLQGLPPRCARTCRTVRRWCDLIEDSLPMVGSLVRGLLASRKPFRFPGGCVSSVPSTRHHAARLRIYPSAAHTLHIHAKPAEPRRLVHRRIPCRMQTTSRNLPSRPIPSAFMGRGA